MIWVDQEKRFSIEDVLSHEYFEKDKKGKYDFN